MADHDFKSGVPGGSSRPWSAAGRPRWRAAAAQGGNALACCADLWACRLGTGIVLCRLLPLDGSSQRPYKVAMKWRKGPSMRNFIARELVLVSGRTAAAG
jgi:hypothetical protein